MIDIFNTVVDFLRNVFTTVGLNNVLIASIAVLLFAIIIQSVVSAFSLESKTARAIAKIENYLQDNPFITNENIVEFNRLMKKIPNTLRVKWQQYVVNRTEKPSMFLNENDCIDKPFKTKGLSHAISQFRNVLIVLASLSLVCSICAVPSNLSFATLVLHSTIAPLLVLIFGFIYITILKARQNSVRAKMLSSFNNMTKLLDRAVTTFPDFVDYEILFTKKEIDAMIPELQEYLRQRALYEQEQLEKAKQSEVEHENYNFSALGVDGSLVMERAMKECEFYLGNRRKTLSAIEQLQSEKDLLTKSYDEKNKVSQRKLRDINESLERLREKLNNTTNKIVGNDIRRQQAEEIKKQQSIEREIEEDNNRYVAELKKVDEQIEAKREEIDHNRQFVEVAFTNEFKAYADKVYNEIYEIVNSKVQVKVDEVTAENEVLKQELSERDQFIAEKNILFNEKADALLKANNDVEMLEASLKEYEDYRQQADAYMANVDKEIEKKNQEIFAINSSNESLKRSLEIQERKYKELRKQKVKEINRYFDANGNEFYYDENGLPYFYDRNGNKVYYYNNPDNIAQDGESAENAPMTKEQMDAHLQEAEYENVDIVSVDEAEEPTSEKPVEEIEAEENLQQEQVHELNKDVETIEEDDFDFDFEPVVTLEETAEETSVETEPTTNETEEQQVEDEHNANQAEAEDYVAMVDDIEEVDWDDEVNQEIPVEENSEEQPVEAIEEQLEVAEEVENKEEPVEQEVIEETPVVEEQPVQEEIAIEEEIANPDEQLEVIKMAIDAEIEKLEQQHSQLKSDIENVEKEVNAGNEAEAPKHEKEKKAPAKKKTAPKKKSKTATKAPAKKKVETNKAKSEKKPADKKPVEKKAEEKKPVEKKASSKKPASKKKTTNKPATKASKPAAKESKPAEKKVEVKEQNVNFDLEKGFEDFNNQLTSALSEAEVNAKKARKK